MQAVRSCVMGKTEIVSDAVSDEDSLTFLLFICMGAFPSCMFMYHVNAWSMMKA